MPIYSYRDQHGHTFDKLRPWRLADQPAICLICGCEGTRIMTAHHAPPDGVYSYAPNLGDEAKFQRNLEGIERLKARIGERKDLNHPR